MKKRYVLPADIARDIDQRGHQFDYRLAATLSLLEQAPLDDVHTVLDVGFGKGEISKWLAQRGKVVTAIGLEIPSYGLETSVLTEQFGISIHEVAVEKMPFPDESFDAIVMSHILEHCPNVGIALSEVWRVLKKEGRLFVFVPSHDNYVAAGHVSAGWTVGQLMYVLLLAGFQVKDGRFFYDGFFRNISGFVTKNPAQELPLLRGDRGDIRILNDAGLLPLPILSRESAVNYKGPYLCSSDEFRDGFWGNIKSINWPTSWADAGSPKTIWYQTAVLISRIMPRWGRRRLATVLSAAGRLLAEGR